MRRSFMAVSLITSPTGVATQDPQHLMKRTGLAEAKNYAELYSFIEEGSLLGLRGKSPPPSFARALSQAHADRFSAT